MTCKLHSLVSLSARIFDKKCVLNEIIQISNGTRCFSVSAERSMRFVQFKSKSGGQQHLGAQIAQGGDIFDISGLNSSIPNSLVKFLATGNGVVEKAKRSVTLQVEQLIYLCK